MQSPPNISLVLTATNSKGAKKGTDDLESIFLRCFHVIQSKTKKGTDDLESYLLKMFSHDTIQNAGQIKTASTIESQPYFHSLIVSLKNYSSN